MLAVVRTANLDQGSAPALASGYTAGLLTAAGLELLGAFLALRLLGTRAGESPSRGDNHGNPFLSSR